MTRKSRQTFRASLRWIPKSIQRCAPTRWLGGLALGTAIALALSIAASPAASAQTRQGGSDGGSPGTVSVGGAAPEWKTLGWVNADSLDIKQLRGRVILLRFLSDGPSPAATLIDIYRTYHAKGLAVVGMYSPSPMPDQTTVEQVRQIAASLGYEFPVGVDSRWETLNRYWLEQADSELTAATFLIDRKGVIRYIQPDGQYEKNSPNRNLRKEYELLVNAIETALKSDASTAGGVEEPRQGRRDAKKQ